MIKNYVKMNRFDTFSRFKKAIFLIGSVQEVFCSLRFRSNRFKHSVKRFDRFGLATLLFSPVSEVFQNATFMFTSVWHIFWINQDHGNCFVNNTDLSCQFRDLKCHLCQSNPCQQQSWQQQMIEQELEPKHWRRVAEPGPELLPKLVKQCLEHPDEWQEPKL